ncbi:phosphatase PAP2 family protein [uncultured Cohaesibacter sp.]|uniref:phosphatase PAP2 family protein n=1 Tax=uncultured Cohaesibacter sp. TaxID=1002546 RepID=UPI0029C7E598|nr:phosphatase PAP2 family protein [uncultured Cohaesibacter sp.]
MRKAFVNEIVSHPIYWASMAILLISAIFLIMPELDLWTSQLFYAPQEGFWPSAHYFPYRLRELGLFLPRAAIALLVLFALARLFWPDLKKLATLPTLLFLALSALLGPGLLVNGLLKAHWGRARPIQTDLFGGEEAYTPVWVISNHCQSNCSFVSGEASIAFWLVGLLLLLPIGWRRGGLLVLASLAILISLNRIAFGGHYLSDILLAWALTGWIMLIVWQLMRSMQWLGPNAAHADKLEQGWDHIGHRLRSFLAQKAKSAEYVIHQKQQSDAQRREESRPTKKHGG